MTRKSRFIVGLLALSVGALSVGALGWWSLPRVLHSAAQSITEARSLKPGVQAPEFALKDARGKTVRLSDFRGKTVLLNFWATWCGPCKMEIPWFVDFQKTLPASAFTVLGVSMDEDGWKVVTPFLAAEQINYPVLLADEEVNLRYGGIESLPTSVLISPRGKITFVARGLVSREEWGQEIARAGEQ